MLYWLWYSDRKRATHSGLPETWKRTAPSTSEMCAYSRAMFESISTGSKESPILGSCYRSILCVKCLFPWTRKLKYQDQKNVSLWCCRTLPEMNKIALENGRDSPCMQAGVSSVKGQNIQNILQLCHRKCNDSTPREFNLQMKLQTPDHADCYPCNWSQAIGLPRLRCSCFTLSPLGVPSPLDFQPSPLDFRPHLCSQRVPPTRAWSSAPYLWHPVYSSPPFCHWRQEALNLCGISVLKQWSDVPAREWDGYLCKNSSQWQSLCVIWDSLIPQRKRHTFCNLGSTFHNLISLILNCVNVPKDIPLTFQLHETQKSDHERSACYRGKVHYSPPHVHRCLFVTTKGQKRQVIHKHPTPGFSKRRGRIRW